MSLEPTDEAAQAGEFLFPAYWVDRLLFEVLPEAQKSPDESRPVTPQYAIVINLGAGIDAAELRGQVTMNVALTGDPKWQPYKIEITVTGQFAAVKTKTTPEQFDAFIRINVPTLLFPYVRELVSRVTHDGRYGGVRLNPMNIVAMLPKEWQPVLPIASTEPEPPSEQSPSASPD